MPQRIEAECELRKERARWSRLRYHHGQRPSPAEPSGACRVTVEGGGESWVWPGEKVCQIMKHSRGLASPRLCPWLFSIFCFFTESRVQFDQFHPAFGRWGEAWRWSECTKEERAHWRVEEGHRAKEGHLWFVVLTGKDWFLLPKEKKQCWQPLLSPFPTLLQNLPLNPKWNEINAS